MLGPYAQFSHGASWCSHKIGNFETDQRDDLEVLKNDWFKRATALANVLVPNADVAAAR